jgi:hypothetical protein
LFWLPKTVLFAAVLAAFSAATHAFFVAKK